MDTTGEVIAVYSVERNGSGQALGGGEIAPVGKGATLGQPVCCRRHAAYRFKLALAGP